VWPRDEPRDAPTINSVAPASLCGMRSLLSSCHLVLVAISNVNTAVHTVDIVGMRKWSGWLQHSSVASEWLRVTLVVQLTLFGITLAKRSILPFMLGGGAARKELHDLLLTRQRYLRQCSGRRCVQIRFALQQSWWMQ